MSSIPSGVTWPRRWRLKSLRLTEDCLRRSTTNVGKEVKTRMPEEKFILNGVPASYFAVPRKLIRGEVWKGIAPNHRVVFVTILSQVNWEDRDGFAGSDFIPAKRGQRITSQEKLAESCGKGITRRVVRRALKQLQSARLIRVDAVQSYTLITVLNYDDYDPRSYPRSSGRSNPGSNGGPNVGQSRSTIEEVKEVKNFENEKKSFGATKAGVVREDDKPSYPARARKKITNLVSELAQEKDVHRLTGKGQTK
jgi:hypothetical protein